MELLVVVTDTFNDIVNVLNFGRTTVTRSRRRPCVRDAVKNLTVEESVQLETRSATSAESEDTSAHNAVPKNVISNVSLEPGAGQGKDVPVDTGFLDSLTAAETSGPAVWNVTVFVDKQAVTFKVDTGAEVTAISDISYSQL